MAAKTPEAEVRAAYKAALRRMASAEANGDPEGAHSDADHVLCEFLMTLGYGDLVESFRRVEKWYA